MRTHLLAAALLALAPLAARADEVEAQEPGRFSRLARQIWEDRTPPQRTAVITSPDGKKAILLGAPKKPGDARHDVRVRVGGRELPTEIGSWVNAEAAWARDSKAFFVTYSDARDEGTYHVVVFRLTSGGLSSSEPVKDGRALWQPACAQPEVPNVAAVVWPARDTSRLVLAVVVPRGSTCGAQRTFRAFDVRLAGGKVAQRYDQFQAKREFRAWMGEELLGAPDECIRNPSACPAASSR